MAWKLHGRVDVLAVLLLVITKTNSQRQTFKYCQSMTSTRVGSRFDCSSLQLTNVPSYLPHSVTELNMDTNYLQDLGEEPFIHLPQLRKLVLSNSDISVLSKKNFQGLGNLRVLDLSENRIRSIECETFSDLSRLEVLDLSGAVTTPDTSCCYKWEMLDKRYRRLQSGQQTQGALFLNKCTWSGLSNLKKLILQNAKIDEKSLLPKTFSALNGLKLLDLSSNRLTNLKAGVFSGLNKLETLILNRCNVKTIENGTFSTLHNLKYLNMMFSNLTEFSSVSYLPKQRLVTLHLGGPFHSIFFDIDYFSLASLKLSPDTVTCHSKKFNIKFAEQTFQRKVSLDELYVWFDLIHRINVSSFDIFDHIRLLQLRCSVENCDLAGFASFILKHSTVSAITMPTSTYPLQICDKYNLTESFPVVKFTIQRPSIETERQFYVASDHDFSCFKKLKELNLSHIDMVYFTQHTFASLEKLQFLNLSYNSLNRLEDYAFNKTASLVNLDLSHNNVFHLIEETFIGLANLRILNLSYNSIQDLSVHTFQNLKSLEYLYLDNNNLRTIPSNTFKGLTKLREIDLKANYIQTVGDGAFSELPSLMFLYLRKNRLKEWQPAFDDFSEISLQTLDIGENLLHCSDRCVAILGNCSRLRIINLSTVYANPTSFKPFELSNIAEMTLTKANVLPNKILAPKLKKLDVSHCDLRLHAGENDFILRVEAAVEDLRLSGNTINSLLCTDCSGICSRISLLANMTSLRVLDLSSCDISVLCEDYFPNQPLLEKLNLSSNKLTYLTADVFHANTKLCTLDLSSNRLSVIDISTFTKFANLRQFYFGNNPLSCSSRAESLQIWMNDVTNNITFTRDNSFPWQTYICKSPGSLAGTPILIVDFNKVNWYIIATIIGSVLIVCAIACVLIKFTFKYRWSIRYRRYLYKLRHKSQYQRLDLKRDRAIRYDAYVSFSHKDGEWVEQELMKLEQVEEEHRQMKFCICHRDFLGGTYIVKNISNAMRQSRKVIFIVSENFVSSKWCLFEIEYATQLLLETNEDNVLFIILDNVSRRKMPDILNLLMNTRIYLEWPGDDPDKERERETFWQKLEMSLQTHAVD